MQPLKQKASNVRFKRSESYKETYLEKVLNVSSIQRKFREFMGTKRNDPYAMFGSSDKAFKSDGAFGVEVPGIKHAHITFDLSIVYDVIQEGGMTYVRLYGFFTHDELGTGQPPNVKKQKSMATRFKNETFLESDEWTSFLSLLRKIIG